MSPIHGVPYTWWTMYRREHVFCQELPLFLRLHQGELRRYMYSDAIYVRPVLHISDAVRRPVLDHLVALHRMSRFEAAVVAYFPWLLYRVLTEPSVRWGKVLLSVCGCSEPLSFIRSMALAGPTS